MDTGVSSSIAKKIRVKVKPGSKVERIFFDDQDILNIAIKERPIEGKANKEVIKKLSKIFSIPASEIELKAGQKSKIKTFVIMNEMTEIELNEKLKEYRT